MPAPPSRRFALLTAYEGFTRRESVCLREESFETLAELQDKKAKVIEALGKLEDSPSDLEREEFNRRIERLLEQERANEASLSEKMAKNRQAYRKLTLNAVSASKLRRAYGPQPDKPLSNGSLKGRA